MECGNQVGPQPPPLQGMKAQPLQSRGSVTVAVCCKKIDVLIRENTFLNCELRTEYII